MFPWTFVFFAAVLLSAILGFNVLIGIPASIAKYCVFGFLGAMIFTGAKDTIEEIRHPEPPS